MGVVEGVEETVSARDKAAERFSELWSSLPWFTPCALIGVVGVEDPRSSRRADAPGECTSGSIVDWPQRPKRFEPAGVGRGTRPLWVPRLGVPGMVSGAVATDIAATGSDEHEETSPWLPLLGTSRLEGRHRKTEDDVSRNLSLNIESRPALLLACLSSFSPCVELAVYDTQSDPPSEPVSKSEAPSDAG